MKRVDTKQCLAHVLVCVNERDNPAMPCCHEAQGDEVYERLRRWAAARGLLARIWITRSGCLGWCHREGTTLVIYPEGVWYRGVKPDDLDAIIAQHLQALVPTQET
ncbi:MAG: (2Fe-2S) ferredoxin domain-containing protein [Bradymonadaceae bacterium]|nr:(2Fe-2S) ferredoxin domain-containing protein [Lujinxingiaceae bacterium]